MPNKSLFVFFISIVFGFFTSCAPINRVQQDRTGEKPGESSPEQKSIGPNPDGNNAVPVEPGRTISPIPIAEERYYLIVFANDLQVQLLNTSPHTYAVFLKISHNRAVAPDISNSAAWNTEYVSISWLPRKLPVCLLCGPVQGYNYPLEETFKIGIDQGTDLFMLPIIQIDRELYVRALKQFQRLNSGAVSYVVSDRRHRPDAVNCVHAVTDVYTSDGYAFTGLRHGLRGSRAALKHLSEFEIAHAKIPPWLLTRLGLQKFPLNLVDR